MCVSISMIDEILNIIHNEEHFDFDRTYEQTICSWYIRDLIDHFKKYLKSCSKYNVNRTKRDKFFDNLQLIFSLLILFFILTIDFIFALSKSHTNFNVLISVICNFNKRITVVLKKKYMKNFELNRNNVRTFEFKRLKIILSHDIKSRSQILSNLRIVLFIQLKVKWLYFTIYYSQIDKTFEKTNHTLKITLRYYLMSLKFFKNWSIIINSMQRNFYNIFFITIKTLNKIYYDFTSCIITNLINSFNIISSKIFIQ